ncbi:MAG: fatty acid desaturase [Paracoccaceae bacterium]
MTTSILSDSKPIEWPTVALILGTTLAWAGLTAGGAHIPAALLVPALAVVLALHSSLQHEVIHGHPLPSQTASDALVFPAIGLALPYERFRDLHLAHHRDARLTDPYDDPESNYLDPDVWVRLAPWQRRLLLWNNTLAGRILLGPAIGLAVFWRDELRAALGGDRSVRRAWALHAAALVPVALWLGTVGTVSAPAYLAACYLGLGLLKIRTFLEHRAHEAARGRTVIVEDRGPLALLFLNNNLHAVHHQCPGAPWYALPRLYLENRARILAMNEHYVYPSYWAVFRAHLLRAKDPVPHPFYPGEGRRVADRH